PGITEELLRSQLYPEVAPEEFRPFLAKMRGILKRQNLPISSRVVSNSWA
ncbi:COMMD1 isoform 5, partial [Pan troglodytes]